MFISDRPSEEPCITTKLHDSEGTSCEVKLYPKQHRGASRRSISCRKYDLKSCPGWRNKECLPGPCTRWKSPSRSNKQSNGNVLPKKYNSKCTNGHESILTETSEDECRSDLERDNNCAVDSVRDGKTDVHKSMNLGTISQPHTKIFSAGSRIRKPALLCNTSMLQERQWCHTKEGIPGAMVPNVSSCRDEHLLLVTQ